MNSKQRGALEAIFSEPAPRNLRWDGIESLLRAIGRKNVNRGGCKAAFAREDKMLYAHRPHPQKEAKPLRASGRFSKALE
jgi:hypothetical protein